MLSPLPKSSQMLRPAQRETASWRVCIKEKETSSLRAFSVLTKWYLVAAENSCHPTDWGGAGDTKWCLFNAEFSSNSISLIGLPGKQTRVKYCSNEKDKQSNLSSNTCYLFDKYLLCTCYGPWTLLGARNPGMNKVRKFVPSWSLHSTAKSQ